jgi:hypothetical protein
MESSQPSKINLRALRNTLVFGAILTCVAAQRYCAFMLIFMAPVFLIWFLYSLHVIARIPERRHVQGTKLTIWLCLFAVIACVHVYYAYSTRRHADDIEAMVEKYTAEHGQCPQTLETFGIGPDELRRRLGVSYYSCDAGVEPHLVYGVTYIAFDMYFYDFTKKAWVYNGYAGSLYPGVEACPCATNESTSASSSAVNLYSNAGK